MKKNWDRLAQEENRCVKQQSPYHATRAFHVAMGLPTPDKLVEDPSVQLRRRRLQLILEEFLETVDAMGFTLIHRCNDGEYLLPVGQNTCYLEPEGDFDPVETADGLSDLNVVVAGTAIELGIPMPDVDHEVYCSNMSKLDQESGKPLVNYCASCGSDFGTDCTTPTACTPGIDPCQPVGKILKPSTYAPANVAGVLTMFAKHEKE